MTKNLKPFILSFAIEREEDNHTPAFSYDYSLGLNTLTSSDKETPVIDLPQAATCLETQTRIRKEQDDIDLLETSTVTKIAREASQEVDMLLELNTKTFASRERDDERIGNHQ